MNKLKDWVSPALSLIVLVVGMAWASGSRDERLKAVEKSYSDLSVEVVRLRDAIQSLSLTIARQDQRLADDRESRMKQQQH